MSLTPPALAGGFFTTSTTWKAPIPDIGQITETKDYKTSVSYDSVL